MTELNSEKIREVKSWVNQQINIIVEDLKEAKRYEKARLEGALSVFKKVQTKLIR